MSVKTKINPGLVGGDRTASLDRYAARLYENPGMAVMGVVELIHEDRVQPAEGVSEKDPVVRLRIESLEVAAPGEQGDVLREVARFLFLSRTASGTLDGDHEVQLAKQTLDQAQGLVAGEEVARLRSALTWLQEQLHGITTGTKLREADMRKAIAGLDEAATKILAGAGRSADGAW